MMFERAFRNFGPMIPSRPSKRLMLALAFILMNAATGFAQTIEQLKRVDIRIAPDLSVEQTIHVETTPLIQSAVNGAAQARWDMTNNQSVELIESFTRKADGRIILADPNEIATQDGVVGQAMSFVDMKVKQIPFRDVAVGDTTVFTLKYRESDHFIPGQYSQGDNILPFGARRTVDVTLRAPAALNLRHDEHDLAYEERQEGEEIIRHWTGSPAPVQAEEGDVANLVRMVPSYRLSTFDSYQAIGLAYDEAARPKEAVTPEVQQLADEITRGAPDVRSQAEAIFTWMTHNMRYVAVYFGRGRYVPNDTKTILSRRFGDCKDHATLMVALLAAKGIEGEQVLINTQPTYQLATTPTLQAFNHAIVYIPALDLYVDPTVQFGAFTRLPTTDLGKPVVRASARGAVLGQTPIPSIEDNLLELTTRIVITANGQQQGQTTTVARGEFVDYLRRLSAQAETKGKDIALRELAKLRGLIGTFDLDAPSWTITTEPYRITATWERKEAPDLVTSGWRAPAGLSPLAVSPDLFVGSLDRAKRLYPAGCRAGRAVHDLDLTLPDRIALDHLPGPVSMDAPGLTYRIKWLSEGAHLKMHAEVTSSVTTRVCDPEQINAIRTAIWAVENRISPQLHFRASN